MRELLRQIGGAIMFYTCLPLPHSWSLSFNRIARWAPLIGILIGAYLAAIDYLFQIVQLPMLTRSTAVVLLWIWVTGGLHLDGAMDTADGLAVEPHRRLEVMADSRTGAFGVMGAFAILLLKTTALADIATYRPIVLMAVATWGRWAQVLAITRYPYLKPEGKGAFHRTHFQGPWDLAPGLVILLGLGMAFYWWHPTLWKLVLLSLLIGSVLSWAVSHWFYQQFQGMTGDIYGAIVEWMEALLLLGFSIF